ncbi:MAG: hypothetical protein ACFFA0_02430 [Promethearchaeota archaeon]
MSITENKRVKKERIALYCDLICGIISSILSLTGIFYFAITEGITKVSSFIVGTIFWILYLAFSIFLICMGIYLWYKEKHWDEKQYKKDLKPPIY